MGETRRSLLQLCETKVRDEMHDFIDHQMDPTTTFATPALFRGDVDFCKSWMHKIASDMDLSMEMENLGAQMRQQAHGESMQIRRQSSNELENQDVPCISESCDFQERFNGSNRRSTSEREEYWSLNKTSEEIPDPNANFTELPFLSRMYTDQLHHRLIEATTRHFINLDRQYMEIRCRESLMDQNYCSMERNLSPATNWKEEHAMLREKFMTRVQLQPPPLLRVIDIEATCKQAERVVLVDYRTHAVQQLGYTAISHTYGMDVYEVFDCRCATECSENVRPRCWDKPCLHQNKDASSVGVGTSEKHKRVVKDILRMCDILREAGVNYAWHDGVCIAQYDESEVRETIKHMGWIYGNAKETVIFLHYVGSPMAPIKSSNDCNELVARWQTRVWTLQEGALSKCRRYCVKVGSSPLGDCRSLEEFEEKIALWNSSTIEIWEEERFFEFLKEIYRELGLLCVNTAKNVSMPDDDEDDDVIVESNWMWYKAMRWYNCIVELLQNLLWTSFEFPTAERALILCGVRESKHVGDRINSILAISEVKDFVAPKDMKTMEASTMEFFKRQGQRGLARAVFSINVRLDDEDKQYITEVQRHTWPPLLWRGISNHRYYDDDLLNFLEFEVREEDGRIEMRGELVCVKVRFINANDHMENTNDANYTNAANTLNIIDPSCETDHLAMDFTSMFESKPVFSAKLSESCEEMGDMRISAFHEMGTQDGALRIAREVKGRVCFEAYLVIPEQAPYYSLLVQGRLDAHVSKIGFFHPTELCIECLNGLDAPAITTVQKLIII